MAMRIWEDQAAMNIVSVLGFLMNDEGDVVGAERTQVLCKLMPSIHTIAHRAILGMLITGLNDTDAQLYVVCHGGRRNEPGTNGCTALALNAAVSTPKAA